MFTLLLINLPHTGEPGSSQVSFETRQEMIDLFLETTVCLTKQGFKVVSSSDKPLKGLLRKEQSHVFIKEKI